MSTPVEIAQVVAAACAAAGPVNNNPGAWKGRVNELIPEVAALMNDYSRQWKQTEALLDASHLVGSYVGYELEESSKRLIVSIMADNPRKPGVPDTLRTARMDEAAGPRMKAKLDRLEVGDRINVWKVVETARNDPEKKIRYIGHFESYGPPRAGERETAPARQASTVDQQAPPAGPVEAKNADAGTNPAGPAQLTDDTLTGGLGESELAALLDEINGLETVHMMSVRQQAQRLGIANFVQPKDAEEYTTVLGLVRQQQAL